jgi:hypothetical protein
MMTLLPRMLVVGQAMALKHGLVSESESDGGCCCCGCCRRALTAGICSGQAVMERA